VVDPAVVSSNAVVTAQVNGVVVKSTVPASTGAFSLSPLTAATYTVVVTADGRASDVITGVPVTAQGKTAVSTSASPLTMAASTSNTVSGTVLPVAAEGSVRATQTFAGGPVTIKYRGADMTTGAYSLALPVAAPMLGQFGTLPIALAAQGAAAGKYSLEASATGYQTQSGSVDVMSGGATKNFTLPQ
ncbi:MAG: carboxypeptidase-like regulatory domain-containing protein, partial [Noviherbaspirillum sp.]